ncbi:MAG: porin [Candidatus Omnitrophica bacterium]|nr:porin [Candidatus Omnitrophota bacterium]
MASAQLTGTTGIGEKAGLPALLELPSGLQGLSMSGYADVSYIYNFAESDAGEGRTNRGRVFDTESNGFTPQAFELVLEKPITDSMPIGFRADLFFGDDAEVIHATGLGNDAGPESPEAFDLQQLYVTARAPVGAGIDFKVGKFVTLLGAEVIESPANWNFSRSYMFGFSIPFTHTGALASYPLGEWGSVTAGVVNGWDIVDDNNQAKSLLGNITVTPMENVTLSFNGITGAERTGDNRNDRSVFDFVGTWQPMEKLTLMANYDFGYESGLEASGAAGGASGTDSAAWTGLALYAKYDLTDAWSLATRWEWFDDKDGVRTGLTSAGGAANPLHDIDFYEWTLTSQWKLHEHLLARLEYRHDKSDERVFFHDADGFTDYQDTMAAELIYHF